MQPFHLSCMQEGSTDVLQVEKQGKRFWVIDAINNGEWWQADSCDVIPEAGRFSDRVFGTSRQCVN